MKKTSRILAIALVLVLIMSLSITALAAAGTLVKDTGAVTVGTAKEGVTYKAVKVMDMFNIGQNGGKTLYQYALTSDFEGINLGDNFKYDSATGLITVKNAQGEFVVIPSQAGNNENASEAAQLAALFAQYAAKNSIAGTDMPAGTSAELVAGYYVIYETSNVDGTVATKPILVEVKPGDNKNVSPKDASVSIDKQVNAKQEDSVSIGDVVDYTIATNFPSYEANVGQFAGGYPQFTISDTLSDGLDFVAPLAITVTVDGTEVAAGDDTYTLTPGTRTFTVAFDDAYILTHQGKNIVVSYQAKVNESAVINDENNNTATVTYSNNPEDSNSTKTLTDVVPVYTYKFDLNKIDGADDSKLAGAKFEMKKGDQVMYFKVSGTTYTYNSSITAATAGNDYVSVIETVATADIVFQGLDEGTYTLTETEAPSGYSMLAAPVTVTVTDADATGDLDGTAVVTATNATVEGIVVTVKNYEGISLPETGSVTSIIVMVVGLMIVLGGAAYLVMSRKKAQSK